MSRERTGGTTIRFYYTVPPLCGIVSLKPMEKVKEEIKNIEDSLRENGVKWEKPVLTIDTPGTPAIPHLRIIHHGYVRLKDRKTLSFEV